MAGEQDRTAIALGLGGVAGVMAAIALARNASANGGIIDEATKQLLIAIAEANAQLVIDVEAILARMATSGAGGLGFPENADSIATTRYTITVINRGMQLTDQEIPTGMAIVIFAPTTNAGTIYVANSRTNAADLDSAYPLVAGGTVRYYIKNAKQLQVSGNTVGDVAVMTVEINGGV
jgi:hypothetical protein